MNNARNGLLISIVIVIIALVILVMVNSIPDVDISVLNSTDRLKYDLGVYETEKPIWKVICYTISGVLLVLSIIINLLMCRCQCCGRHINCMNIFTMYCPYCGKSLDITRENCK